MPVRGDLIEPLLQRGLLMDGLGRPAGQVAPGSPVNQPTRTLGSRHRFYQMLPLCRTWQTSFCIVFYSRFSARNQAGITLDSK